MGWFFCDKDKYKQDVKECVLNYCFNEEERKNIKYIECKKDSAYMIYDNGKNKYGLIYAIQNTNYEFGYKDMDLSVCPYYYNCSEKFYKMCKEIYSNTDSEYAKQWLKNYEEINAKKKQKQKLIKSLKVGDIVEFINANYGNQKQWRVSSINGTKILFEGYNLIGWKNKDFIIV